MSISFIRTIILYIVVAIILRLMGKRQIGQLKPSELVVTIMISELASIPMQETGIPLFAGIIPILTLFILEVGVSFFEMKNKKFRRFVGGTPSVIIHNGNLLVDEMTKIHFNRDDVLEELRLAGYANIKDVHFAILETNGQLSVFPKTGDKPLVQKDINKINKKGKK